MNVRSALYGHSSASLKGLKHWLGRNWRIGLTALGIASGIIIGRSLGLLEPIELSALDYLAQRQPSSLADPRIVLVTIDENDLRQLQTWPISDEVMAELLTKLQTYEPRVIGLDIYRNLPVQPGQQDLQQVFTTTSNVIGIEKLPDLDSPGVTPPPALAQRNQVGFNNVVVDVDGKVRRSLLFWRMRSQLHTSLSLQLALKYLKVEGITPQSLPENPRYFRLGKSVLQPLSSSFGSYAQIDAGGYQIMADLNQHPFQQIAMRDVLKGNVPSGFMRDRIVLIGSTAGSLRDIFYTPFSYGADGTIQSITGVELQAHFVSQILNAAFGQKHPLHSMPNWMESLWIVLWTVAGATLCWRLKSPGKAAFALLATSLGLSGTCYGLLSWGWWVPWVPSALGLVIAAIAVMGYIAHQEEELKKSKDFLNSIINAIPDPVFVKDNRHRWILLNAAYANFAGYPVETLIDHTEFDILPDSQARRFWGHDHQTFAQGHHESEDEFTNAQGITYRVSTKRSVHRDAAGNVFLVGTIRDITQLKQREDELRRTAEELVRSNEALRALENRLRYMAYYDTLTGLPNRDLFEDRLRQAIEVAREHNQCIALLFLDLDGFKQVNDTYGHLMGDLVLKAVSQRLHGCLRSSDTVARLSGDEFVVLLPAIPLPQDAVRVANKILATLCQNFVLEGHVIHLTSSVGISLFPQDGTEPQTLLQAADSAMYEAKTQGKNQYQFFRKPT